MDISLFKKISITGRYAFALRCVENAIIKENFTHPLLSKCLQLMWEYVYSNDLYEWYLKISKITPDCMEMKHTQLENNTIGEFKILYAAIPDYLVKMIDWTWAVGLQDMFSGTDEYSSGTLGCSLPSISMRKSWKNYRRTSKRCWKQDLSQSTLWF